MHGVWTKVVAAFTAAGYDLVRVVEPEHSNCGGRTYRNRIVCLFARREYLPGLLLDSLQKLSFSTPPPSVPFGYMYELDRTQNLLWEAGAEEQQSDYAAIHYQGDC